MHLFVDTTRGYTLGLFDGQSWVERVDQSECKKSQFLHADLYQLLKNNNCEFQHLRSVMSVAGPGSYTGMRLGEGLCQLLGWQGVNLYSFYHYEVPKIVSYSGDAYLFISQAYKGEFFVFNSQNQEYFLADKKTVMPLVTSSTLLFSYDPDAIALQLDLKREKVLSTSELIESEIKRIFKFVTDSQMWRPLFYYRPLEKEFKVSL